MTLKNPPLGLQNAGATHTAEVHRAAYGGLIAGSFSASPSLRARGGIHPWQGGVYRVQQAASPNMSVDVLSGMAFVTGTQSNVQSVYAVVNDATVNLAITTADPSNPRIDIVVLKVEDTFYSGVTDLASLAVVVGTPSGSPAAPSAPANSIVLAQVAVGAGVTSIVNANITDTRSYYAATGGTIYCTSSTRPGSGTVPTGQVIYETDTTRFNLWNGSAWTWPLPRGRVGGRRSIGNVATVLGTNSGPSEYLVGFDSGSLTLEANRSFEFLISMFCLTTVSATTTCGFLLRETNLVGTSRLFVTHAFGVVSSLTNKTGRSLFETGGSPVTVTLVLTALTSSGTIDIRQGDSARPVFIEVNDLGPSGRIL